MIATPMHHFAIIGGGFNGTLPECPPHRRRE
jgi:hypothetical protein